MSNFHPFLNSLEVIKQSPRWRDVYDWRDCNYDNWSAGGMARVASMAVNFDKFMVNSGVNREYDNWGVISDVKNVCGVRQVWQHAKANVDYTGKNYVEHPIGYGEWHTEIEILPEPDDPEHPESTPSCRVNTTITPDETIGTQEQRTAAMYSLVVARSALYGRTSDGGVVIEPWFWNSHSAGSWTYSNPVDINYLLGKLGEWQAASSKVKFARSRGSPEGVIAFSTESNKIHAEVACSVARYESISISTDFLVKPNGGDVPDEYKIYGYKGGVAVEVECVTRRNHPVVYDGLAPSYPPPVSAYGYAIFNDCDEESILEEEITEGKWMDGFGAFDTAGDAAAEALGWNSVPWLQYVSGPAASMGVFSRVKLWSADGGEYRVTLCQYMAGLYSEERGEYSEPQGLRVVEVKPELSAEMPLVVTGDDVTAGWQVIKIEQKQADGTYVDVTATKTVSDMPGPGVAVLMLTKNRQGGRWGYPGHVDWRTKDPVDCAYYRKRTQRNKARAISR